MRIGVWNCHNGLKSPEQIKQLASLKLDVAIIPELRKSDISYLHASDSLWVTNNHSQTSPKGLGVLAFGDWRISSLPRDAEMEIYVPFEAWLGNTGVNILAVWNFYSAAKQGRFRGAKGDDRVELVALEYYRFLMKKDFVMAGDFNFGPTFSQASFVRYCQLLEEMGVHSLYHNFFELPYGATKHATFRHSQGNLHHLDHIFASEDLLPAMRSFEIMDITKAVRSDHAAIVADLELCWRGGTDGE